MSIVLTSLGRILELPISIKHIRNDEKIVATNAPGGRLGIKHEKFNDSVLKDISEDDDIQENICLPLIEDYQLENEKNNLSFANKLKMVDDMEHKYTSEK